LKFKGGPLDGVTVPDRLSCAPGSDYWFPVVTYSEANRFPGDTVRTVQIETHMYFCDGVDYVHLASIQSY